MRGVGRHVGEDRAGRRSSPRSASGADVAGVGEPGLLLAASRCTRRMRSRASASITGPTQQPGSSAGPTVRLCVASTSRVEERVVDRRRARSPASRPSTSALRSRTRCRRRPATASSRSASSSTMIAFLPPISAMTRLTWSWPGAGLGGLLVDQQADVARAGEGDQRRRPGCSTSVGPISSPTPGRKLTTPGGQPGLAGRPPSAWRAMTGDCSAGFMIDRVAGDERRGRHAARGSPAGSSTGR